MQLVQYTFKEHLSELKTALSKIFILYFLVFAICYFYSENIFQILLNPLMKSNDLTFGKIIYTGLTEAFLTYIKLAAFVSFVIILPIISYQIYSFIQPGLYSREKTIIKTALIASPFLFWLGAIFVFQFIMPNAWKFFLSFENKNLIIPIILEAKISEYLILVIQFILAFGLAFQMPIIIVIMYQMKLINITNLIQKRRLAILINFIIAGIITPPDVFSQITLALPMILLYEISIVFCKLLNKSGKIC